MTLETPEPRGSPEADARSTAVKKSYRCYFTGDDDRIRSFEQIDCENDTEAALKAQELLAASQFTSAELWQSSRLVGKWSSTDTADSRRRSDGDSNA